MTALIVFSGLPGTGKTTLAQQLVASTGAVYLRIDTIEQAIRNAGVLAGGVGTSGYQVALELARSNLAFGRQVIVDCVNPVEQSRMAWRALAEDSGVALLDIQVVCSDQVEHRRRVESRQGDIPGLVPPDWQSVLEHDYAAWEVAPFTIDTASMSVAQAVTAISRML